LVGCSPDVAARATGEATGERDVSSPRRAEFEETFDRWKLLLGKLRDLELTIHMATGSQLEEPIQEYYETLTEGFALEAELLRSAARAFVAEPEKNNDLKQFLTHVAWQLVSADCYEDGLRITGLLLENQIEDRAVYESAARAAFACSEFDLAERYLRVLAKGEGRKSRSKNRLRLIAPYREAWASEQELRQAEQLAADLPRVLLRTERGEIELELFENEAPNTVANFIGLVERGFYDGLTFHHVLSPFGAQAGCPHGDGTGSPGYFIPHEFDKPDHRIHFRGSLGTVTEGPYANGCQFCLTFQPRPEREGRSTVFGRIVRGIEVLARLQRRSVDQLDTRIHADRILTARVLRKRNHEYKARIIPDPNAEEREASWQRMKRLLSR
jgi:cyclophilin family peptidyl-prolyl cis-trans isomerase